ncbi:MAG TPA: hypothetical protein VKB96_04845 [Gammaproteobacteria bacterium]|nr:hypothetical protein [Gammaproteobacteria bacterium]
MHESEGKIARISGDKAYDARECYAEAQGSRLPFRRIAAPALAGIVSQTTRRYLPMRISGASGALDVRLGNKAILEAVLIGFEIQFNELGRNDLQVAVGID